VELAAGRAVFPLVPRYRLAGLPFGSARSTRRGRGSDLAGFRAYVPGDPVSTIDWRASARLSSARGDDEFVVRERFADEAPRVVVVVDRRPSMGLYPDWSPWLSKPAAIHVATEAIVASAMSARGAAGYLDTAGPGAPYWIPPRGRSALEVIDARATRAEHDADAGSLERGLEYLARSTSSLGSGTFVFIVSDFLEPPPDQVWLAGIARRWELVPVVIQDPVWEQSFPWAGPVIVPLADPDGGAVVEVRLKRSEARAERERREHARSLLLSRFASLGLDPVLLEQSEPDAVTRPFLEWAEGRRRALRQRR
jgi:uncharacterized protein (DUF58 family)